MLGRLRKKSSFHLVLWIAAIFTGIAAVLFGKSTAFVQNVYFELAEQYPLFVMFTTPFLFLLATYIVEKFSPQARGSGIPQVLYALELTKEQDHDHHNSVYQSLISLKTAGVKIISALVGMLGGASVGREGPTVQISVSIFAYLSGLTKKYFPKSELQSFLTAGAGAGVSAAFNTPLAGIIFAFEEISEGVFGHNKSAVMIGAVLAGLTAQAIVGDYLFFGHPVFTASTVSLIIPALILGLVSGVLGGAFAKLIAEPLFPNINIFIRSFLCGVICAVMGYITLQNTSGTGYEVTKKALEASAPDQLSLLYPILKMISTTCSYYSGMAGGIFSPILSIGAGLGLSLSKLAHLLDFKACALIGMVGFFAGTVQAPLTAVVIVMEMTDERALVLPFVLAAFIAQSLGKVLMPVPLYRSLMNSAVIKSSLNKKH